jgi:hypothetical protein
MFSRSLCLTLLLTALQDGYGYYSGSSQICPAGTYNGKGNKNPCTP